jgi:hypothetical protein
MSGMGKILHCCNFLVFGICVVEEERKEIIGCEEVYVLYLI